MARHLVRRQRQQERQTLACSNRRLYAWSIAFKAAHGTECSWRAPTG